MSGWSRVATGLVVVFAVPVLAGCSLLSALSGQPPRGEDGQVTASADAGAFSLRVGDCITTLGDEGEFESLPVAPCEGPHEGEVYAEKTFTEVDRPPNLDELADEFCGQELATFLGGDNPELEISVFTPTVEGWGFGDRLVQCVVTSPDGSSTGSLRGTES